jgi:hypothetical protein
MSSTKDVIENHIRRFREGNLESPSPCKVAIVTGASSRNPQRSTMAAVGGRGYGNDSRKNAPFRENRGSELTIDDLCR